MSLPPLPANLKGRDLLTLADFSPQEILQILDWADVLKKLQKQRTPHHYLAGKTLAMIFEKSSTRTRVSFETGIYQLGGQALFLSSRDIQLGRGESIADTARVLSRYVDGIMIRTYGQQVVEELAAHATVPVINGLTDLLHPCQILADLQTIREYKGRLQGLKLAFVGDGNNVCHSLLIGCSKLGLDIAVATPPGYRPAEQIVARARDFAAAAGSSVLITGDPAEAVRGADVLVTDVWASMGQEQEQQEREKVFAPYQLNAQLVALAAPDYIFLHCLPAHRGEEVTAEIIDGPHSAVWDEAENRLHAQKAVMALLMQD
ncbi:MAG: ornithine carbamoyltransferase [Bacillota bacterium]|uniref:ornithine carbamoyltransferase n=1 Tax=Desulfurispora thermophila TaxID=265470 RepID=UPI0003822751